MKLAARVEGKENLEAVQQKLKEVGAVVSVLKMGDREVVYITIGGLKEPKAARVWKAVAKALEGFDYRMAWQ